MASTKLSSLFFFFACVSLLLCLDTASARAAHRSSTKVARRSQKTNHRASDPPVVVVPKPQYAKVGRTVGPRDSCDDELKGRVAFIDPTLVVPAGKVVEWKAEVCRRGIIRFQIWRPRGADPRMPPGVASLYELVGENVFESNDTRGQRMVVDEPSEQIATQEGDVVGFTLEGPIMGVNGALRYMSGSISFSKDPVGGEAQTAAMLMSQMAPTWPLPTVGSALSYAWGEKKVYSIRAKVLKDQPAPPPPSL
eukprot:GILK01003979.1.p1 GENE.GILK01003979.1~~GILK01003979.1.p1  ORF type:complete len:267 (+),score=35.01 GILK01003979.1:49-801(+)